MCVCVCVCVCVYIYSDNNAPILHTALAADRGCGGGEEGGAVGGGGSRSVVGSAIKLVELGASDALADVVLPLSD